MDLRRSVSHLDAGRCSQRHYDLREEFNALRWIVAGVFEAIVHDLRELLRWLQGRADQSTAAILDSRTLQSTPESGGRASWERTKRRKGSKVHVAVDMLGNLLALQVITASEQDRSQVGTLLKPFMPPSGKP